MERIYCLLNHRRTLYYYKVLLSTVFKFFVIHELCFLCNFIHQLYSLEFMLQAQTSKFQIYSFGCIKAELTFLQTPNLYTYFILLNNFWSDFFDLGENGEHLFKIDYCHAVARLYCFIRSKSRTFPDYYAITNKTINTLKYRHTTSVSNLMI